MVPDNQMQEVENNNINQRFMGVKCHILTINMLDINSYLLINIEITLKINIGIIITTRYRQTLVISDFHLLSRRLGYQNSADRRDRSV